MGQPSEAICLNFMIGQMGSHIIQTQKVTFFWIRTKNLGEFLIQNVQNDVYKKRSIERFSWWQRDDLDNSDGGETYQKYDFLCTDKVFGPSWTSYVSTYPYYGFQIFKAEPGLLPGDEIARSLT
jgi:hypothetical protein